MIETTSLGLAAILALLAQAPTAPPPPAPAPTWKWNLVNMTRLESWRFFEPPPTGGDPDYAFVANRLRLSLTGTWKHVDASAALQYVQFGGLPADAVGPGALGTGALYYQHSGDTASHGLYLRTLNVRVRLPQGVALQAGRFAYVSGGEAPSGRPKIEAVKRSRVDSRLIGEFEWSLYQRSFDGVRADVDRKGWHATGSWLRPTQGGFEEDGGRSLADVDLITGVLALRPDVALPATDLTFFAYRYADDRRVAARPDNSGLAASRVDVGVTTIGASAVGAVTAAGGEVDYVAWFAAQTGDWYGQSHRAWSLAAEAGYQWKQARWQPWARGGYLHASGDGNPSDDRHGTFFPMVPTLRKYSMTTVYSIMNLDDLFAEIVVRPTARLTARVDVRRLWLAEAADRWYAGSGATQRTGTFFGYSGRRSGGSTDLAPFVMQGAADVTLARRWTANAFVGAIRGGDAVASSFQGRWLSFFYLENVVQW
jgi:Alginate export